MKQKILGLSVARIPGETLRNFNYRQDEIESEPQRIPAEKIFADLLKRKARESMAAVSECPAVSIPHALARLADVQDVIRHAFRHDLVSGAETLRSEAQLIHAHTLADLLECIAITQKEHRAPVFLNSRDSEISKLRHDFSQLAGLVCMAMPTLQMPEVFCNQLPEAEIIDG